MGGWSKMERFLFFPQIQGGPQIILNFNLLASLNLREIKVRLLVKNGSQLGEAAQLGRGEGSQLVPMQMTSFIVCIQRRPLA